MCACSDVWCEESRRRFVLALMCVVRGGGGEVCVV